MAIVPIITSATSFGAGGIVGSFQCRVIGDQPMRRNTCLYFQLATDCASDVLRRGLPKIRAPPFWEPVNNGKLGSTGLHHSWQLVNIPAYENYRTLGAGSKAQPRHVRTTIQYT